MAISKSEPIIIIGAGAFGLSSALHLSQDGYTDITVLERDTQIPPRYSAANDLNKIVRAEYEDPFYTDLTIKAIEAWKQPIFAPHFHQVGFLHCVSPDAPKKAVQTLQRFQKAAEGSAIQGAEDIRSTVAQLRNGPFPGWSGYLNTHDGYAHSANALAAVHREARSRGVKFVLGRDGEASQIMYNRSGRATGVLVASGKKVTAKLVIVAAGAAVSNILPAISSQVVAKSWSIAHVKVSEDEAAVLRGMPVTYARDLGFMFEPDRETGLLKLCPMGGGYINTNQAGVSLPPTEISKSAFMPPGDEAKIRKLLAQTLPDLADRPLVRKQLCWFADTADSDFIVDYVPGTCASVAVLSGDSGHGFKMFPIAGEWAKNLLASNGKQTIARWKWKGKGGNAGKDDISWRVGDVQEFLDIAPSTPKL